RAAAEHQSSAVKGAKPRHLALIRLSSEEVLVVRIVAGNELGEAIESAGPKLDPRRVLPHEVDRPLQPLPAARSQETRDWAGVWQQNRYMADDRRGRKSSLVDV